WKEGGVEKKASRTIEVRVGDSRVLDLMQPEQVGNPKKNPKKEPVVKHGPAGSRKFLFTYAGAVKDLEPGTEASISLPLPWSTAEQAVSVFSKQLPADATTHQEKQYGNRMMFFKAKADAKGEIPFKVVYSVLRREVKTDFTGNLFVKPRPGEQLERFLQADKL